MEDRSRMTGMARDALRHAGWVAAAVFVAALAGFGAALEGFEQSQHPVAVLGANGIPRSLAFNLLGFVLPGMLAGVVAMDLRRRLPAEARWPLRIGAQLVFLSALAFIAMGLLPLDPQDLENPQSRLHGTAWMLWIVAFIPGAVLLGLNAPPAARLRAVSLAAAVGLLLAAFLLGNAWPVGVAQRLAFGIWFAWLAYAGLRAARGA